MAHTLLFALCGVAAASQVSHEDTELFTEAHFFAPLSLGGQVLEALPIKARSVRGAGGVLRRDGFSWVAAESGLAADAAAARGACGADEACLRRRYAHGSAPLAALSRRVEAALAATTGEAARCSSGATVFSRRPRDPQNAHYDAVASDTADCGAVIAAPDALSVRAWTPLAAVTAAPLLLANTSALYGDACPRRAAAPPGSTATARVFSRDEFVADCAGTAACDWYHALGVEAGEVLFFRNGEVLHGTAAHGGVDDPPRIALAIDCTVVR